MLMLIKTRPVLKLQLTFPVHRTVNLTNHGRAILIQLITLLVITQVDILIMDIVVIILNRIQVIGTLYTCTCT